MKQWPLKVYRLLYRGCQVATARNHCDAWQIRSFTFFVPFKGEQVENRFSLDKL